MNKNAEDKQLKSGPDCHVAIAPRNDGQLNDVSTYFDQIDCENRLNKRDTSASNSCLPQYDEAITDINTLRHSEPDVNSGVKNL